jgi:phospholipid/cholesterol/gamma-HCH transport system substrate-binding protein
MFFLIALLLVGVIALYLGDFWVRARSYPVTAYFANVQGLPNGAEVRFAGVRVGRVTAVTLGTNPKFPKRPAAVKMAIIHGTVLYQDDQFLIQQSALLGDKYVEVKRTAVVPRGQLSAGAEIPGGQSVSLENLTEEARALVREARATMTAIRGTLASEYNQQMLRTILANVAAATNNANKLALQGMQLATVLTKSAEKAGPDVAAMASNLREASASVKNTAQLVRTILATSPVPRDMAEAGANIRNVTEDIASISDNLAQVLAHPDTRKAIQDAMDNLRKSTENLATVTGQASKMFGEDGGGKDIREALARLREAATSVSNITCTYEKLLTDPSFTCDVRQTVASARQAAESGARAIEKAECSLDRLDETMESVTRVTKVFSPEAVRTTTSLEGSRDSALRADFKVDLQYGKQRNRYWRVGIRDVGDAETLILQRSFGSGKNGVRAGIYGNKVGVGYDVNPQKRLGLEADLWNPEDLRLDMRGTYRLSPKADALFGFNEIGEGTDPFVGVRYKTNP